MHTLQDKIRNQTIDYLNRISIIQENAFISNLKYANPPIKGEITRGKIKWRGIKACIIYNPTGHVFFITQRGVKIGNEIIINRCV